MNAPVKTPQVSFPEAFIALQAAIKPAIKDAKNDAFKRDGKASRYADFGAVWDAIKEPLHTNGFAVTQLVQYEGETMFLETILLHSATGPCLKSQYPLRPTRADPQGFGSAITYAKRYALCAMLGVVADDDDDGNKASERPSNPQRDAIHTPKTMGVEARPNSAPPVGEDPDVVQGVINWRDRHIARINACERLPDTYMWEDEYKAEMDKAKSKAPEAYKAVLRALQTRREHIAKKEVK